MVYHFDVHIVLDTANFFFTCIGVIVISGDGKNRTARSKQD